MFCLKAGEKTLAHLKNLITAWDRAQVEGASWFGLCFTTSEPGKIHRGNDESKIVRGDFKEEFHGKT